VNPNIPPLHLVRDSFISPNTQKQFLKKTRKIYGFTETLKNHYKEPEPPTSVNPDICKDIFTNGSKVTKKYFYPSEFPKITKIKPITLSITPLKI